MSLKYRPEIDGLRTIAVGAVLIYHAKFPFFSGAVLPAGYLGVDVFFVISGFLITSLILQEWDRTGRFSILNFYERRARRLLPALFAVIFATLPVAWVVLMPSEMEEFVRSLIASVFFLSNMFWHFEAAVYGAAPGALKPFLHTWSLAVEEQFYIFFPLIYILLLRHAAARIIPIGLAAILIGLIVSEITTRADQSLSFYWVISRLWELMAGAVLAHFLTRHPGAGHTATRCRRLPAMGLALIVLPMFVSGLNRYHPGLATIPAVLGTVLIIWFGGQQRDVVTRLLSSKAFVGIGLISYSLYLWHYPIMAFGRLIDHDPGLLDRLIWLALSFALAVLSYRVIERPFRTPGAVSRKGLVGSISLATALVVGFTTVMLVQDGRRERFPDLIALYGPAEFDKARLREEAWQVLADYAAEYGMGPSGPRAPSQFEAEVLWYDMDQPGRKVLVLGNSLAKDMFDTFHLNTELFPDIQFSRFGMKASLDNHLIDGLLASPNFQASDTVLLAFAYTNRSVRRMPNLLDRLLPTGKQIVLLLNSPSFADIGRLPVFDWYIRTHQGIPSVEDLNAFAYTQLDTTVDGRTDLGLLKVAEDYDLPVLRRYDYVCDDETRTCDMITDDGRKIFYDYHHYSKAGAKHFGAKIARTGWLQLPPLKISP
ncbi:acyltransferase family protein [uncultured Roseobacter sp.]|uniref:acyltransferase family protein n=1 Tax=uncultured Roseobacter sp. TaxID=114847 RepID=UPI002637D6C1|nr:acyltransferase family protein [uncultured Roseobacter sp.]